MLLGGIIDLLVGLLLIIVGIFMCLGHINLLHSYHINHIKEEDKKVFALKMGISMFPGGLGLMTAGILSIVLQEQISGMVIMIITMSTLMITIIASLIIIKKYNGNIIG